jgi:signal transduction protein with GAF and PtsI domain
MNTQIEQHEHFEIAFLHELGERIAASDPLQHVLARVVEFVTAVVHCDSCFLYVLEDGGLTLRASKNPHPEVIDRIKLRIGQGITGWVAEQRKPVAIASNAFQDPRFQSFSELPEDRYEAFLSVPVLCRDNLVGVINLQHRQPHTHTQREIQLISTIGFLVGPEIEMARREAEKLKFSELPEAQKLVEQAAQVLQRDRTFSEEEAFVAIQKQSRRSGKSMKEIASAVLLFDELAAGR